MAQRYIRIIAILDDHGDQTLVGNTYEIETAYRGGVKTTCQRHFFECEYVLIPKEEAV